MEDLVEQAKVALGLVGPPPVCIFCGFLLKDMQYKIINDRLLMNHFRSFHHKAVDYLMSHHNYDISEVLSVSNEAHLMEAKTVDDQCSDDSGSSSDDSETTDDEISEEEGKRDKLLPSHSSTDRTSTKSESSGNVNISDKDLDDDQVDAGAQPHKKVAKSDNIDQNRKSQEISSTVQKWTTKRRFTEENTKIREQPFLKYDRRNSQSFKTYSASSKSSRSRSELSSSKSTSPDRPRSRDRTRRPRRGPDTRSFSQLPGLRCTFCDYRCLNDVYYCPWCIEESSRIMTKFDSFDKMSYHMLGASHKKAMPRDVTCPDCSKVIINKFDHSSVKDFSTVFKNHISDHRISKLTRLVESCIDDNEDPTQVVHKFLNKDEKLSPKPKQ